MRKVQRDQMGAYLCIASNDVPPAVSKRVILNVNCKQITHCRAYYISHLTLLEQRMIYIRIGSRYTTIALTIQAYSLERQSSSYVYK